jgi:clan AA aspartic protease
MRGRVNEWLELVLDIRIEGLASTAQVAAIVDTGFSDYLKVPEDLALTLGLPFLRYRYVLLGDDEPLQVPVHGAIVVWGGERFEVDVIVLGESVLLGQEMLRGHRLVADVLEGGALLVQRISNASAEGRLDEPH